MHLTQRICVVGAAGAEAACEQALAGREVVLCDADGAAATTRVAAAFALARRLGRCSEREAEQAGARIAHATDLARASVGCAAVVEAVAGDRDARARALTGAAGAAPDALLVTTAPASRVTDLACAAGAPGRVVGVRCGDPWLLMPFAEVVAGEGAGARRVAAACDLVTVAGKLPIVLRGDVAGSVMRRLQLAVIREAAFLVEEGAISGEGLDTVVREGLARRWRHVGPLRALALGGLDTWNALARNIAPELSTARELPDMARLVADEHASIGPTGIPNAIIPLSTTSGGQVV